MLSLKMKSLHLLLWVRRTVQLLKIDYWQLHWVIPLLAKTPKVQKRKSHHWVEEQRQEGHKFHSFLTLFSARRNLRLCPHHLLPRAMQISDPCYSIKNKLSLDGRNTFSTQRVNFYWHFNVAIIKRVKRYNVPIQKTVNLLLKNLQNAFVNKIPRKIHLVFFWIRRRCIYFWWPWGNQILWRHKATFEYIASTSFLLRWWLDFHFRIDIHIRKHVRFEKRKTVQATVIWSIGLICSRKWSVLQVYERNIVEIFCLRHVSRILDNGSRNVADIFKICSRNVRCRVCGFFKR